MAVAKAHASSTLGGLLTPPHPHPLPPALQLLVLCSILSCLVGNWWCEVSTLDTKDLHRASCLPLPLQAALKANSADAVSQPDGVAMGSSMSGPISLVTVLYSFFLANAAACFQLWRIWVSSPL